MEINPLNPNERNLVAHLSKKGVMLSAALLGHRASSTRAELGAGIAAMFADEPTHQGTDSQSYLIKASQILQGKMPKQPWDILTDGDLWKWFAKVAEAKGVKAVKLTKVKGHATDKMIREGKVTQEQKDGNDGSDEAADMGVDQHGNQLLETSIYFVAKQTEYGSFIDNM